MASGNAPLPFGSGQETELAKRHSIPPGGLRFILPIASRRVLQKHPLSCDLYPYGVGYYPTDRRDEPREAPPCFILYYCVAGEARFETAAGDWPLSYGEVTVIPSQVVHGHRPSAFNPWSFFWVGYSGRLAGEYTRFISEAHVVHVGVHPELTAQFTTLCNLASSGLSVNTLMDSTMRLRTLLTSFATARSYKTPGSREGINLNAIREFMAERLGSSLTLKELAEVACSSPYHFVRTFKKQTGLTPMHYFIQMRLRQACTLLDTTQYPIKQIAASVGYPDQLYFSRLFHRMMGMSPGLYRCRSL